MFARSRRCVSEAANTASGAKEWISPKQIQRVAAVVHKPDAETRNISQSKQSSSSRRAASVIQHGRRKLHAAARGLYQEPIIAVDRQDISIHGESHSEWVVQSAST